MTSLSSTLRVAWALLAVVTLGPGPARAANAIHTETLARWVPGDARLFFELRDVAGLIATPAGAATADTLARMTAMIRDPATTRPTSAPTGWQTLCCGALGLPSNESAELLLTGRLALAADGWGGLANAILLAEPKDPAALEAVLSSARRPETRNSKVRRYGLLTRQHELACDGKHVMLGRAGDAASLYARTLELWTTGRGVSLSEVATFRERTRTLPPEAQLLAYAGIPSRTRSGDALGPGWWPSAWPQLTSAAIGVVAAPQGIVIEADGQLDPDGPPWQASDPPVPALVRLPASTIVAWTRSIDYVSEFRRLDALDRDRLPKIYVDRLRGTLSARQIEDRFLGHLVGDSVLLITGADTPVGPPAGDEASEPLVLPALVLAVQTDAPQEVKPMVEMVAGNLLHLLHREGTPAPIAALRREPLGDDGEQVISIPVGELLPARAGNRVLRRLQISWVVADRWLIIGTDAGAVRDVALARRGKAPVLPGDVVPDALRQAQLSGASAEMILVARPQAAADMIDSWVGYITRHHPQMLESRWWQRLRQRYQASRTQLGVVPRGPLTPGQVRVDHTMGNYPAHTRLQPDDIIVAVDGQTLDPERTLASLGEMVAMREDPEQVTLHVVRQDQPIDVEIPMPHAGLTDQGHPIALLGQVADLMRMFSSASYAAWRPSPERVSARLELRYAPPPAPATQPATAAP